MEKHNRNAASGAVRRLRDTLRNELRPGDREVLDLIEDRINEVDPRQTPQQQQAARARARERGYETRVAPGEYLEERGQLTFVDSLQQLALVGLARFNYRQNEQRLEQAMLAECRDSGPIIGELSAREARLSEQLDDDCAEENFARQRRAHVRAWRLYQKRDARARRSDPGRFGL